MFLKNAVGCSVMDLHVHVTLCSVIDLHMELYVQCMHVHAFPCVGVVLYFMLWITVTPLWGLIRGGLAVTLDCEVSTGFQIQVYATFKH